MLFNCHKRNSTDYNYTTIKDTDSTSYIQWTDGNGFHRSSKPIDNFYIDEKTHIKWSNKKYICLRRSNGSDTWTDIILPFDNNNYRLLENVLAYDKQNGIAICETDSSNYKLYAENINSGKREYLGKNWESCSSIFPHYCIDSISIFENKLYVEWVLPNVTEKTARIQIKKIRLNLIN